MIFVRIKVSAHNNNNELSVYYVIYYYYLYIPYGKTEAQKSQVTCPRNSSI